MVLPRTASKPEMELEWKIPEKSNAIERDRARTYHEAFSALIGAPQPGAGAGRGPRRSDEVVERLQSPARGDLGRLLRGGPRRALASHGDPGRQGGELPAIPADAVERQPRATRTALPAPTRTRCKTPRSSRRTGRRISRAWTSCGRCGASIRACRAASTCTTGEGVRSERCPTRRPGCPARDGGRECCPPKGRSGRLRGPAGEGRGADRAGRGDLRIRRRAERREDLVGAVLEMHGAGLARIGEVLDEASRAGEEASGSCVDDGIVASLLLIHDLYPVPIDERVTRRSRRCRPYMESHGGDVELISLEDGVARIRLKGSCDGCPASSSTLELAIKTALDEAAPDLTGIEVEGLEQDLLNPVIVTGTPLPMAGEGAVGPNGASSMPPPSGASAWHEPQRRGRRAAGGPAGQGRRGGHSDRGRHGRGFAAGLSGFLSSPARGRSRTGSWTRACWSAPAASAATSCHGLAVLSTTRSFTSARSPCSLRGMRG